MQPEKIINNQPVGRKCQGRRDEREKRLSGDPCLHTLRPCQVIRGGRAHKLLIKFWVPPGCDCPSVWIPSPELAKYQGQRDHYVTDACWWAESITQSFLLKGDLNPGQGSPPHCV